MKSYTSLEQSMMLSEILPLESADMYYPLPYEDGDKPLLEQGGFGSTPCWSLSALLSVIPYYSLHKTFSGLRCDSYNKEGTSCILGEPSDNPIDACVVMIEKLHELNLL